MDITKIKRMIGHCQDMKELREVVRAANARERLLGKRIREKAVQEKHEWAKTLKRGDKIYCAAQGTFIGGSIQRGDFFYFNYYQPRAKRLWFHKEEEPPPRNSDEWFWMEVGALSRYSMQSEPPEKPLDSVERAAAAAVGKILSNKAEAEKEEL